MRKGFTLGALFLAASLLLAFPLAVEAAQYSASASAYVNNWVGWHVCTLTEGLVWWSNGSRILGHTVVGPTAGTIFPWYYYNLQVDYSINFGFACAAQSSADFAWNILWVQVQHFHLYVYIVGFPNGSWYYLSGG
jgi:hypothetical protein